MCELRPEPSRNICNDVLASKLQVLCPSRFDNRTLPGFILSDASEPEDEA